MDDAGVGEVLEDAIGVEGDDGTVAEVESLLVGSHPVPPHEKKAPEVSGDDARVGVFGEQVGEGVPPLIEVRLDVELGELSGIFPVEISLQFLIDHGVKEFPGSRVEVRKDRPSVFEMVGSGEAVDARARAKLEFEGPGGEFGVSVEKTVNKSSAAVVPSGDENEREHGWNSGSSTRGEFGVVRCDGRFAAEPVYRFPEAFFKGMTRLPPQVGGGETRIRDPHVRVPTPLRHGSPDRFAGDSGEATDRFDDFTKGGLGSGAEVVDVSGKVPGPVRGEEEGLDEIGDKDIVPRRFRGDERRVGALEGPGDQGGDEASRVLVGTVGGVEAEGEDGSVLSSRRELAVEGGGGLREGVVAVGLGGLGLGRGVILETVFGGRAGVEEGFEAGPEAGLDEVDGPV
jgi:hypothetical protein